MARTDWQTPKEFYARLDTAVGGFAVDAAADSDNHLCGVWYGPGSDVATDALSVPKWLSPAFCNPPYFSGKDWKRWLAKFVEQGQLGVDVVALLPASTGVGWWEEYVVDAKADVMLITSRLHFTLPGEEHEQPNHNSAVVIYGPSAVGRIGWLKWTTTAASQSQALVSSSPDLEQVSTTPSPLLLPDPRELS